MNKIWLKKIFGDPRNFGGSDLTNELNVKKTKILMVSDLFPNEFF